MRTLHLIAIQLFISLLLLNNFSFAKDFEIDHQFNSGDVISADVLNDVFDGIKNSKRSVTENDLVGSWSCESTIGGAYDGYVTVDDWQAQSEGLYYRLTDSTLTFSDDGDDSYTLISSTPNPFSGGYESATNSSYVVYANTLYFTYGTGSMKSAYFVNMVSDTRFVLYPKVAERATVVCDKQNLPPDGPTLLSVSVDGNTVSLSWTDNASDETWYIIYRRDELTAAYNELETIAADSTSYSETVSTAGTYWYRVKAKNDDGNSVGSNVVKVIIE